MGTPETFEVEDLDRLIRSVRDGEHEKLIHVIARLTSSGFQATKDLENFDKDRHNEFKRYEMMKEHKRREHLKGLSEEERQREEQRYKELRRIHAQHPKVNHPVRAHREKVTLKKPTHKHKLTHYMCVCVCVFAGQSGPAEGGVEGDGRFGTRGL